MSQTYNAYTVCESLTEYWSPQVIGQANGQLLKVAKVKGEFVWHNHENEDEVFFILKGMLYLELKSGTVHLQAGDSYTVPKGVDHKPYTNPEAPSEECWILLIEPASTLHSGSTQTSLSRSLDEQTRLINTPPARPKP